MMIITYWQFGECVNVEYWILKDHIEVRFKNNFHNIRQIEVKHCSSVL